jgi:hypothetical protein
MHMISGSASSFHNASLTSTSNLYDMNFGATQFSPLCFGSIDALLYSRVSFLFLLVLVLLIKGEGQGLSESSIQLGSEIGFTLEHSTVRHLAILPVGRRRTQLGSTPRSRWPWPLVQTYCRKAHSNGLRIPRKGPEVELSVEG